MNTVARRLLGYRPELDASLGLVHSQSVLGALLEKSLSREQAYELVQRNASAAWDERRSFLELLKSDPEVTRLLDLVEIEACFDNARYVENAAVIFDRLESL